MGTDIYAAIAKRLRLKRLQAGLTIEDLADAAGISVSFLAYLETNKKKPSLDTLTKLAAVLKTPVSGLFNEKRLPDIPCKRQRLLSRVLKLLHDQSPENTDAILATAAVLARSLKRRRP